jgi:response regulator NasT
VRSKEELDIIAEAKAILMERNNMSEEEAHRYLQKTSMDTGTGIVEAARMVALAWR